jgi:hypothetical protein
LYEDNFLAKVTKKARTCTIAGTFEESIALNTLRRFGYHFEVEAIELKAFTWGEKGRKLVDTH